MIRLVAIVLAVSACTSAVPAGPAATLEQPVRGGVVVQPIAQDIKTLQPVLANEADSLQVIDLIYDMLWLPHPLTSEPRPHLASWEVSADARAYTWRIAPSASWSDGRPIVAVDVLAALKAFGLSRRTSRGVAEIAGFQDYATGRAGEIAGFVLDAEDPKRFVLHLAAGSCNVPLVGFRPLPAHVFAKYLTPGTASPRDAIIHAPENEAPTVVSGPFRLQEWRRGERVSLVRNESYWRGAPYLDGLAFEVMPQETWPERVQRGRLGYFQFVANQRERLLSLERDPGLHVFQTTDNSYLFIAWNTQSPTAPALRDRRVRQALAYSFDWDLALQKVRDGRGVRTRAHHVPGSWAHAEGLNPYAYDSARAKTLLAEAGYTMAPSGYVERDGSPLSITLLVQSGNAERQNLAQFAADQYARIGVRLVATSVPFDELLSRLATPEGYEAVVAGFVLPVDGDPVGAWHSSSIPDARAGRSGNNFARFVHPQVDAAIEAARRGPDCSIATRKRHYEAFNRILNDEQPFLFGFVGLRIRVARADLRGFEPPIYGNDTFDVQKWWLAPEKK